MGEELKARGTSRLRVDADNGNPKTVTARAGTASAYYGGENVSASSNDGTLAAGGSITITSTKFFLTAGTHTRLLVSTPESEIFADTDGATITFDMAVADTHSVTLGGNRTLAVRNDYDGQRFTIILKQDGTGTRLVTWWSGILWPAGGVPTLTTTNGKTDVFVFIKSGATYLGFIAGQSL